MPTTNTPACSVPSRQQCRLLALALHRLWHLRRLQPVTNFDESWSDESSCYGHNPSDIQPFHDLFLDLKEEGDRDNDFEEKVRPSDDAVMPIKKYYTNEMLYELLRPDGMASTYVYDHFLWKHCDVSFECR